VAFNPSGQRVESELMPNESVLWESSPSRWGAARSQCYNIGKAIVGLGFCLGFAAIAGLKVFEKPSAIDYLFLAVLALVLLSAAWPLFRPVVAFWRAGAVIYLVTTHRCIIIDPVLFGGVRVRSFWPLDLLDMWKTVRGSGHGDLVFRGWTEEYKDDKGWEHRRGEQVGFLGVEDVRAVESLIRDRLINEAG
tara:strand:+ start:45 stop:620 length:576 start_codon:yes stop_codon:yes gene_type:complete